MEDYEIRIKRERRLFFIIVPIVLVIILIGISYAFFNYTRTGTSNTIRVGRISFVSKNEQTITLNNLFPIDPSNTSDMNDNTKVGTYSIDIKGDTDYVDGIEYLVSAVDANIYTSEGQIVPITLDFTVTDLGDPSANYFTARDSKNANIYKKLVGDTLVGDQMLLVGYIKPNTTSGTAEGVDGSITIKAYLDKNKILISDTYDGTESDNMGTTNNQAEGKTVITTAEWNGLQTNGISFKIKVEANEGIWVNGPLEEIMRVQNLDGNNQPIRDDEQSTFVTGTNGIDFGSFSSNTNGKGVYMRAGTENDANPVLYYRGNVTNNNVIFNNQCWKMVRTTETGGVKLIYNGVARGERIPIAENDYTIITNSNDMTYDSTDNTWVLHSEEDVGSYYNQKEISFSVPTGDEYQLELIVNSGSVEGTIYKGTSGTYQKISGIFGTGSSSLLYNIGPLSANNSIKILYYGSVVDEQDLEWKFRIVTIDDSSEKNCYNDIGLMNLKPNENGIPFSGIGLVNSPAYSGYMFGNNVYTYMSRNISETFKFGTGFTYENGVYKLVNAENGIANTRHYTCFTTNEICDGDNLNKIYYIYYKHGNTYYYIELQNGKSVEDALAEMQTNTVSSYAKQIVDDWYENNMVNVTNKLEDTIWCNDRSIGEGNNNGWIANGGDLSTYLSYGAYQRSNHDNNTSLLKNKPNLTCANKNDRFTVNTAIGNGALEYPTALLTEDELVLAGGVSNVYGSHIMYLNGEPFWTMTPTYFDNSMAYNFIMTGNSISFIYAYNSYALRPAISIKPGQLITKGTGTVMDPYVIE